MTLSRLGLLMTALAVAAPVATRAASHSNAEPPPAQVAGTPGSDPVTVNENDIADPPAKAGDPLLKPIVEQHPVVSSRQFPAVEFFVGYSYANLTLGSQSSLFAPAGHSFNGLQFDAKVNLREHIALLFDVAGQFSNSKIPDPLGYEPHMELDTTQFLAGPEFTLRTRNWNTFAHTLFGLTRTSLSELNGYTDCLYGLPGSPATGCPDYVNIAHRTNLAFGAGGGIERNWKKHFAFRLLQADYIPTRLDGKWQSHFRLGTGMIVKF